MNASKTALVAILTITSLGLVAGAASACGGKGGGYGGGYGGYYPKKKVYVKKVYVQPVVVEPCHYPQHCFAIVCPGDTWYTLSLREYGKPHLWKKIALFNGMPLNAGLQPGMQLKLPEIHPNGALLPSSAPAPIALAAPAAAPVGLPAAGGIPQANFIPQGGPQFGGQPQGAQFGPQGPTSGATMNAPAMNAPSMNAPSFNGASNAPAGPMGPIGGQNRAPSSFAGNGPLLSNAAGPVVSAPSAPVANIRTVAAEAKLPSIAIGSILSLDGQSLGDERGSVRLIVSGITLPVEVLEWDSSEAKIQLPQIELSKTVKAEIEVVRADGSVASKSAIELTPAASRLALRN